MRRALSLLLTLAVLLPLALSCTPPPPAVSEEEILPVAAALLEASKPVNLAFVGDGIPVREGTAAVGDFYFPADEGWLEEHGITTLDDLRAAAEAVYTPAVTALLFGKAFPTDSLTLYDYQVRSVATGEGILVLIDREPMFAWYRGITYEYLTDTMRLAAATAATATVTLSVRMYKDGGAPLVRELSLPLVLTEAGWRCDKLTSVAYAEELE
ncbi:MAG: hypothetical protein IJF73_05505 [Clostridia bacterium]|nr:hypothetical protein [Clostridia bacterium]